MWPYSYMSRHLKGELPRATDKKIWFISNIMALHISLRN